MDIIDYVLGVASLVTHLGVGTMTWVDFGFLFASSVILALCAYIGKRKRINRLEGILMMTAYVAYIGWLIYTI